MKTKYSTLLFFILIFVSSSSYCQQKSASLEAYLTAIENNYNVVFNYNSKIIENKKCASCFLDKNLILKQHLAKLKKDFNLDFTIVSETKIIIHKPILNRLVFLDSEDRKPIRDIFVNNFSRNKTWLSDEKGIINFKNNIPEKISTSHLIYGKKHIYLDTLKNDTIHLKKISLNLNELFLYSFFADGTYKNKKGDFFIKTKEVDVLAGLTSQDVIKNLENLPQITSNNESVSDLTIRGGTQDQNLFVWNDIKVYQNHHFFGLISAFNENLISKINVYDNATPAEYGNNTSGVISLEHDSKISKKTTAGLGINFLSQDGYLKLPLSKKSEIQVSGRKSMTEFWKSPTYLKYSKKVFQSSFVNSDEVIENNDITNDETFSFHDFQLQYLYKPNVNNVINLNGIYLKNHLSYLEEDVQNINSKKSELEQNNLSLGINWAHYFKNKGKFETIFNYSKHIMDGGNFLLSKEIASNEYNSIENYETKLQYTSKLNTSAFNYNIGFAYDYLIVINNTTNFNSFYISNKQQNNSIYNLYGAVNYQKNKVFAGLEVRNSFYEFLKSVQIEPRFYFNYEISPKFYAQLRGERKTQNISQIIDLENNFLGIEKRRWIMANNTIAPIQKSNQIEQGFSFKTNKSNISASIYHKSVNGVTTSNQGFQNLHQFENQFGKYTINGFQAHYNFKSRNFNTWLSYNYSVNKYEFKSLLKAVFYNNNDIRNRIISGINYKYKSFNLSLGMEYNSGKPFTSINNEQPINEDVFSTINYNTPNTERLPYYLQFDSTISYQFTFNKLVKCKMAFGMINITNRKNILNRYYTLTDDKKGIEVLDKYGLEFTPNFSLNFDF